MATNNNPRGSTKAKVTAIALLIAAIATAVAFWADGDDSTNPDVGSVIDAGQEVQNQFSDEDEIPTDPED